MRWAETEGLFILHIAETTTTMLPKRCVGPHEQYLRRLLNTCVDQRQPDPGRPPAPAPAAT